MLDNPYQASDATFLPEVKSPEPPVPRPWGFMMTWLWMFALLAAWLFAQFAVLLVYLAILKIQDPALDLAALGPQLERNGFFWAVATLVSGLVACVCVPLSILPLGYPLAKYLAWRLPTFREALFWVLCFTFVIFLFDLSSWLSGREMVPGILIDAYRTSHWPALLALAIVGMAPLSEELLFRGFLYRGLSESWPGPLGAIGFSSFLFAILHMQYDPLVIVQVGVVGALLGLVRWRTNSLPLTIALHAWNNLFAFAQVVWIAA